MVSGKRVLFYRPPPKVHVSPFPQRTVPLGLMTMAAFVRSRGGHDVRIVDSFEGHTIDDLARIALEWSADIVAISGLTAHAYDAMVAAHRVKEARPETLVVVGGIHFSAVPLETLMVCPHIDVVVLGEGELTLAELCDVFTKGSNWRDVLASVAGLAWLDEEELVTTQPREVISDLGVLPMPAFDLVDPNRYGMRPFRYGDRMMIEGSRGCPFSCTFCHTTQFWKRRWRPRPVEAMLEDMSYVSSRMGRTAFHFADDSWGTRRERVIEFCEGVLSRGMKVDLWAQCRVDDLYRDRDLFPLMREAGFYGFLIGFESGSEDNLARWNKGTTAEKARALAPELNANFDSITGTFFIGDWDTTEADFHATRRFAEEVGVDIFIESTLTLFPPTVPMWKEYEAKGVEMEWDYDAIGNSKVILPTHSLTTKEVSKLQGQNMGGFYADPAKFLNALRSGRHAARSYSGFIVSGLEDAARGWVRPYVPNGIRGMNHALRAEYKAKHLALARARGMVKMDQPWAKLKVV